MNERTRPSSIKLPALSRQNFNQSKNVATNGPSNEHARNDNSNLHSSVQESRLVTPNSSAPAQALAPCPYQQLYGPPPQPPAQSVRNTSASNQVISNGPNHVAAQRWNSSAMTSSGQGSQGNAILVSKNQQGNPLLKCLRNINYRNADVLPDYQINDRVRAQTQNVVVITDNDGT